MRPEVRDQILNELKGVFEGALTIAGIFLDEYNTQSESANSHQSRGADQNAGIESMLTIKEAAAFLKVSERTLYDKDAQGKIPTRRVGGELRFLREELLAWTEKEATEARERARAPRRRSKLRIAGGGVIN